MWTLYLDLSVGSVLFILSENCATPPLSQSCGLGYEQAKEAARKAAEDKHRMEHEAAAKREAEAAAAQTGQPKAVGAQSAEASSGRGSSLRVTPAAAEAEKQCWDTLKAAEVRRPTHS